jgi:hypothetical protein
MRLLVAFCGHSFGIKAKQNAYLREHSDSHDAYALIDNEAILSSARTQGKKTYLQKFVVRWLCLELLSCFGSGFEVGGRHVEEVSKVVVRTDNVVE